MSQVKRNMLRVYPLKGMDLRWKPDLRAALLVEDMTWDDRSGWVNSGGFAVMVPDDPGDAGSATGTVTDPDPTNPTNPGDPPNGGSGTPGANSGQ